MPKQAGFEHWEVQFDKDGKLVDAAAADALVTGTAGLADLFIFSHGWNNDAPTARRLYERFFGAMQSVLAARSVGQEKIGTCGIIWPSIRWPDEEPQRAGGAASLTGGAAPSAPEIVRGLATVFDTPEQAAALDEMADLLERRPKDPAALARFQELLAALVAGEGGGAEAAEDSGESALLAEDPAKVFEAMATVAPRKRAGAVGIGDAFDRLWDGAREAARATSYWQMKNRAAVVGEKGLGPLVARLNAKHPALRVHLLGHSFGARVVSFSLKGLPAGLEGEASPVKSLTLLQGAFSHFAFADALPHDTARSGALKGLARRVDGPLVVSHSKKDTAVGVLYPKASLLARADAAALDGKPPRWGAMGSAGAQAVSAAAERFKAVGSRYAFQKSRFLNLDGNQLITKGGPPSGAHSDIVYPEIAWAVLAAAGVA